MYTRLPSVASTSRPTDVTRPCTGPRTAPGARNSTVCHVNPQVLSDVAGADPALLQVSSTSRMILPMLVTINGALVTRYNHAHVLKQDLIVGGAVVAAVGSALFSGLRKEPVVCDLCQGTGGVKCFGCGGDGKMNLISRDQLYDQTQNPRRDPLGRTTNPRMCKVCKGTGLCFCSKCKGSGYVSPL